VKALSSNPSTSKQTKKTSPLPFIFSVRNLWTFELSLGEQDAFLPAVQMWLSFTESLLAPGWGHHDGGKDTHWSQPSQLLLFPAVLHEQ
jgi:hypothetical protein